MTKSQIPELLRHYLGNSRLQTSDIHHEQKCNTLDPIEYLAASSVFPMKANNYVVDELIDWSNVPNDPIFQLVFPQPGNYFDTI